MALMESFPEYANKLSPKSISSAKIVFLILSFIPIVVGIFIVINSGKWIPFFIMLIIGLLTCLFGFVYAKKRYQYTRWWFVKEGLYIQKGVIWRTRVFVPYNRVQHTDVAQGPLERKYNLGQLIIHTAGTKDSSVTLKGIEFALAHELRNKLIDEEQSDAV